MESSNTSVRRLELADLIAFVEFINQFRRVERLIWYKGQERREQDGEHCFQLAIVAWFVRDRCNLQRLDLERILTYALVHDLPETYEGDSCWFAHPDYPQPSFANKEAREKVAKERIEKEWGVTFPSMVEALQRYCLQEDEESRFVYALDKLVSDLNVYEDEGRTNVRLGVTRAEQQAYKVPRIARHKHIAELYEELLLLFDQHPEYFHQVMVNAAE